MAVPPAVTNTARYAMASRLLEREVEELVDEDVLHLEPARGERKLALRRELVEAAAGEGRGR